MNYKFTLNQYRKPLDDIKDWCAEFWQHPQHPHFTRHGIPHSESIQRKLEAWLGSGNLKLTPAESFVLLGAVFLHDIGMQCQSAVLLRDVAHIPSPAMPLGLADLELVRKCHSELSRQMILDACRPAGQRLFPEVGLDCGSHAEAFQAMSLIARGHAGGIPAEVTNGYAGQPDGPIRLLLLQWLLRVGDALDADAARVNADYVKHCWSSLNAKDKFHTLKHQFVGQVQVVGSGVFQFCYNLPHACQAHYESIRACAEDALRKHLHEAGPLIRDLGLPFAEIRAKQSAVDAVCPYPIEPEVLAFFAAEAARMANGPAGIPVTTSGATETSASPRVSDSAPPAAPPPPAAAIVFHQPNMQIGQGNFVAGGAVIHHHHAPAAAVPPARRPEEAGAAAKPTAPHTLEQWAGHAGLHSLAVVFTDLIDATAQNQRLGDKDWQAMLDAHFDEARRLVQTHHGWSVKTIGDAVLAVFRNSVDALNFARALEGEPGHEQLRVRAGIHTGQVTVAHADIAGTEANLTSRICGQAEHGGIWVSARVHDEWLTYDPNHKLGWRDEGQVRLKGFEQPCRLWSLPPSAQPQTEAKTEQQKTNTRTTEAAETYRGILRLLRGILQRNTALARELLAALESDQRATHETAKVILDTVLAAGLNESLRRLWRTFKDQASRADAADLRKVVECLAGAAVTNPEWLAGVRADQTAPISLPAFTDAFTVELVVAALLDRPTQWKLTTGKGFPEGTGYVPVPSPEDLSPRSDVVALRLKAMVENLLHLTGGTPAGDERSQRKVLRDRLAGYVDLEKPFYTLFPPDDPLLEAIRTEGDWRLLLFKRHADAPQDLLDEPARTSVLLREIFAKLHELEASTSSHSR